MALENGNSFSFIQVSAIVRKFARGLDLPSVSIPDTHARVKTSSYNSVTIKSDGIYLTEVSRKSMQTSAFGNAPDLGRCVVTPRYDYVTLDFQTSNAGLMTDEDISANALPDIPNPQGSVA